MINIVDKTRKKEMNPYLTLIEDYYFKTLEVLNLEDNYDLSLIICGKKTIRRLNRDFRKIDRETDVISFASIDDEDDFDIEEEENFYLGDIFINAERVKSQAKAYGHSEKREFVFLFVHGLLHLLGYDHMNEKDEQVMFGYQKKIVEDLK